MKHNALIAFAIIQAATLSYAQTPLEEASAAQAAQWAGIRAKALPSGPASKECEIIEGSKSPNGRYAFGVAGEITCVVDLKADKVLAWSAVAHYGPNQTYNHNTHETVWSADSTKVVQMGQGKWETIQADGFGIADGKVSWLGDLRGGLNAAAESKAKTQPVFEGVVTIQKLKFGKNGAISGDGMTQVPRGDGGGDFTFSGAFVEGKFKVESLRPKPANP